MEKRIKLEGNVVRDHLDPVWNLMTVHRDYLSCFLKTHNRLFSGNGPIPSPDRHSPLFG